MRRILWMVPVLAFVASAAHAETMRTSYYRAEAPYVAAHRTLPIGTRLIITNPRNGRSTCVMIGTRGPYSRGRDLDISREFARHLGFENSGVASLESRIFEPGTDAKARRAAGASD